MSQKQEKSKLSSNAESVRAVIREIQQLTEEKNGIIEETGIIEIAELDEENSNLKTELSKLRTRLSQVSRS